MIACLRKAQKWAIADILAEYRKYSYPKNRDLDERFIYDFDVAAVSRLAEEDNVPSWSPSGAGSIHPRGPASLFEAAGIF